MLHGAVDLQVIVTVAMIVCASVVALALDYLRHHSRATDQARPNEALGVSAMGTARRVALPGSGPSLRSGSGELDASSLAAKLEAAEKASQAEVEPLAAKISIAKLDSSLPPGIHHTQVLHRFIHTRQRVNGLVVVVGAQTAWGERGGKAEFPGAATEAIGALMEPTDFGAPYSQDEFVLVLPSDHIPSAQRRMGLIVELLRETQLRSSDDRPIVFHWGSVEARAQTAYQTLDAAVSAAGERMRQSSRSQIATDKPSKSLQKAAFY